MKRITLIMMGFLAVCTAMAQESLKVKTFVLSNGMEVWINEDHSLPKAFGAVVVKAGARDCPGTGIAHYFEHIMFKGTEKIGTLDYSAEKPYLDSIAVLYDLLSEAPDAERGAIQKEINRLNIAASQFAVPNEFNNLITECGGSNLNAYTSNDVTVYHNEFVSAYFEQWAELNSERLIDPVFRLFQSELETVYEEKNRAESNEMSAFSLALQSEGYKGTPYAFPIIGTTESLKTPRLSQMADFFEKYYVAGNMGLMLTGDIYPEKALPILEKTFGRIRKGTVDRAEVPVQKPYNGNEEVTALVKIPFVRLSALCFQGPSKKDADCLPMSLMAFMLNNSEGIGLLDKLMTDKKLMAAICMYPDIAFDEAGLFFFFFMPKLLFQRSKKAEAQVLNVLDKIKQGDFSEEYFESCKMTYKKHLVSKIETLSGRMGQMVNAYQQDRPWEDVLQDIDSIDTLSKADIVALANRYFTQDRLVIRKKYGDPEKDNLSKPPYDKVAPKTDVSSAYAIALRSNANKVQLPRLTINPDKDASLAEIQPLVNLYTVANPLNEVFNLTIEYPVGTIEYPALERVATYLSLLGTDSMDYETHRSKLQALGGSVDISASDECFTIKVSGFDRRFREAVALVADLLEHPKADKSKLSILMQGELSNRIMLKRDLGELSRALRQYLLYGNESEYLQDKGKIESDVLLSTLREILAFECDIHYSGTLTSDTVASILTESMTPVQERKAHPHYTSHNVVLQSNQGVFFIPKKKSPQTRIYALVPGEPLTDFPSRFQSRVAGAYFGGGMGSVLFQEIREYRSLAYSTNADIFRQYYVDRERTPVYLSAFVGTQGDKTIDSMTVLDSLIKNFPLSEKRFQTTKKDVWIKLVTNYPSFRFISKQISSMSRAEGVSTDLNESCYTLLEQMKIEDMGNYWNSQVANRPIVWAVVGDPNKIDMDCLKQFGGVTVLKPKNVMK